MITPEPLNMYKIQRVMPNRIAVAALLIPMSCSTAMQTYPTTNAITIKLTIKISSQTHEFI